MDGCPLSDLINYKKWQELVTTNLIKGFLPCCDMVKNSEGSCCAKLPSGMWKLMLLMLCMVVADRIMSRHTCGMVGDIVDDYFPGESDPLASNNVWCWMEQHPRATLFLVLGMPVSPRITVTWLLLMETSQSLSYDTEWIGSGFWIIFMMFPNAITAWAASHFMYKHMLLMPILVVVDLSRQLKEFREWRDLGLIMKHEYDTGKAHDCVLQRTFGTYFAILLRLVWNGKWLSTVVLLLLIDLVSSFLALHSCVVEIILVLHFAAIGVEACLRLFDAIMSDKQRHNHGHVQIHSHGGHHGDNTPFAKTIAGAEQYELQHMLGSGSFGTVFIATSKHDNRTVAIKRIPCVDFHAVNKAMNEVRSLMYVQHPNVVEYLNLYAEGVNGETSTLDNESSGWILGDQSSTYLTETAGLTDTTEEQTLSSSRSAMSDGVSTVAHSTPDPLRGLILNGNNGLRNSTGFGGFVCMVMEYCPNGDLETYAARKSHVTNQDIRDWTLQIARALAHLHAKGVVHRDLKPRNILVAANGSLKVADFGLARSSADSMHSEVGTLQFAAPELFSHGQSYTEAIDLFSFGCTMYALVGRFPKKGSIGLLMKLNDPAFERDTMRAEMSSYGLDNILIDVILGMLSVNPEERPSAAAIVSRLTSSSSLT